MIITQRKISRYLVSKLQDRKKHLSKTDLAHSYNAIVLVNVVQP